jgi:hypothetical protein
VTVTGQKLYLHCFFIFDFFDYLLQKATFSFGMVASFVTQECATTCTPSSDVACTQVAIKNQVLGCYVGTYYTTSGSSTFAKTICPLVSSGKSAGFCKVRHLTKYKWDSPKKTKNVFLFANPIKKKSTFS